MKSLFCFIQLLYFSSAELLDMNGILKEFSWPLKLKILGEYFTPTVPASGTTSTSSTYTARWFDPSIPQELVTPIQDKTSTKEGVTPIIEATSIIEATPIVEANSLETAEAERSKQKPAVIDETQRSVNLPSLKTAEQARRANSLLDETKRSVGLQSLKAVEQARRANTEEETDDKDMRLKLFRLMYETVRDSDLKVKRAELIKDHYTNSTAFEVGYLVGDITDKSNIITDIAQTLKRFHKEWKPMEHINAYEQIANQAIEITHLVDLVRLVSKRDK